MKLEVQTVELSGEKIGDRELVRRLWRYRSWMYLFSRKKSAQAVKSVFLRDSRVTKEGIQLLSVFERLAWLDLAGCQGLDAIALLRVGQLRSLTVLNLERTNTTDDWLPCLKMLFNLRWLGLDRTQITREAVCELRKFLPEPTIFSPFGIHYGPKMGGSYFGHL
jgi:hypothetical protein